MFSKDKINNAWNQMRKNGEFLYQARAYEQFTTDPESTLYNGMRFRNDLQEAYNRSSQMIHPPVLMLIQFNDSCDQGTMSIRGIILRNIFGRSFNMYRVGKDVFAVMGVDPGSDVLMSFIRRYEESLEVQGQISCRSGASVLSLDITSVDLWFQYAGLSLEEAWQHGNLLVVRTETGSIDVPGAKKVAGG
jgi:hypothetical protein